MIIEFAFNLLILISELTAQKFRITYQKEKFTLKKKLNFLKEDNLYAFFAFKIKKHKNQNYIFIFISFFLYFKTFEQ